jgi:hypothetical protein
MDFTACGIWAAQRLRGACLRAQNRRFQQDTNTRSRKQIVIPATIRSFEFTIGAVLAILAAALLPSAA